MKLRNYLKIKEQEAIDIGLEKEAIKRILIDNVYLNTTDFYLSLEENIDPLKLDYYLNKYLIDKIPVQYIASFTYFYGLKLTVSKDTLIPRSDTEVLVSTALRVIKEYNYKNILEIGTGSGAISIALASVMTDLTITATDISKKALEIAQKNAIINKVNITFIESDLYQFINSKYDLIISNPPYLDSNNYVSDIVLNNEPSLALFASEEGLYFYNRIINKDYLNDCGSFLFEIGSTQYESVKNIAIKQFNCQCSVYKDLNNLDRVVHIKI